MSKMNSIEKIILKLLERPMTFRTKNKLATELKLLFIKQN